jgi:hypothetical protein
LWKNHFDPYVLHGPKSVHLCGSSQWTKSVFKHILQTFVTKWTFPSLTVVLIPISTHPSTSILYTHTTFRAKYGIVLPRAFHKALTYSI